MSSRYTIPPNYIWKPMSWYCGNLSPNARKPYHSLVQIFNRGLCKLQDDIRKTTGASLPLSAFSDVSDKWLASSEQRMYLVVSTRIFFKDVLQYDSSDNMSED